MQEKLLKNFQTIKGLINHLVVYKLQLLVKSRVLVLYIVVCFCILGFARFTVSLGMYLLESFSFGTSLVPSKKSIYTVLRKKDLDVANPVEIITEESPLYIPYVSSEDSSIVADDGGDLESKQKVVFRLLATLEGDPSFARALIFIIKPTEFYGLSKGNFEFPLYTNLGTAKIIKIGQGFIKYREDGEYYTMYVGDNSQKILEKHKQVKLDKFDKKMPNSSNKKNTLSKVISREEVSRIIGGNQANLLKGASFGPYVKNGVISGYKLHRVTSKHVFYKLGARSGDILTSVNDFKLNDTRGMLEIWSNLETANKVSLTLIRSGKNLNYTIYIQD